MGTTVRLLRHNVVFLSRHPVLGQFAADMAAGLEPVEGLARPVLIYCGVHSHFTLDWFRRGPKLALQTEQFFDASGLPLWGLGVKQDRILRAIRRADVFLDMSACNRPYYEAMALRSADRAKLRFGPHVFASSPYRWQGDSGRRAAFYGAQTARREHLLANFASAMVGRLPNGVFGADLALQLAGFANVLNLHANPGQYTEVPRVLSALIAGKPLISEPLAWPFAEGRHYFGVSEGLAQVSRERRHAVFTELSALVTGQFSLAGFLHAEFGGA